MPGARCQVVQAERDGLVFASVRSCWPRLPQLTRMMPLLAKAASVLWQPAAMGQSERSRGLIALSCFHLSCRQRKQYQAVLLARASSHRSSSMRAAGNLWRRYGKCSTTVCMRRAGATTFSRSMAPAPNWVATWHQHPAVAAVGTAKCGAVRLVGHVCRSDSSCGVGSVGSSSQGLVLSSRA